MGTGRGLKVGVEQRVHEGRLAKASFTCFEKKYKVPLSFGLKNYYHNNYYPLIRMDLSLAFFKLAEMASEIC